MDDYNLVKINSFYLSEDGTDASLPCRVEIPNLTRLRITPRNVEEDLDGGQHVQFGDFRGFDIPMSIMVLNDGDLTDLISEINEVEEDGSFHNLVIVGDTGNFDVDCALVSIGDQGFSDGRIESIELLFRVDTMNEYVAPGP